MSNRIELLYTAADRLAQAILSNRIPMKSKELDPNRGHWIMEECVWPETYLAWKRKVIEAEHAFGRQPLTEINWATVYEYLLAQYGFEPIEGEKRIQEFVHAGGQSP